MILIPGFTDSDKVPGGVAINQWGAGKISVGAIPLKCTMYGNKTSGGSAANNSKNPCTTPEESDALWGAQSELGRMAQAALDIDGVTLEGVVVAEASGAAATAKIVIEGSWTAAGEATFQLDEDVFRVAFSTADNTKTLASTEVVTSINQRQQGRLFCTAVQSDVAATVSSVTQPISGTAPVIGTTGVALNDYNFIIQITTGATLASGNVRFKWSSDGGATYTSNVTGAATVLLGTTGVTATFAAGTYVTSDLYTWSATLAQGVATMTVANIGVRGNQHTLFLVDASKRPSGMTIKIVDSTMSPTAGTALSNTGVPFAGGTGTDDLTASLAALSAVQDDYEAFAQNDATNIGLVETAANNKAAFDVGLLQQYVVSTNGTLSGAIAIGQTQMNDVLGFCGWVQYGVEHPSRVAARQAALFSVTDGAQPNTNYDDVVLPGAAPHYRAADSPNRATLNAALNAGVTPYKTVDGKLQIVRAINSHCLNGSTPDYRTLDHSETTVPIRVRKEILVLYAQLKVENPYSGPDVVDGLAPEGTLTPLTWNSKVQASLKAWETAAFNWLTDVDNNLPQSEWNNTAKRIMSVVPTVVKPQDHALGVIVRQQAA